MSDKDKMQADAVNRAREMYRRSQNYNVNNLPNGYNGNIRENHKSSKNDPITPPVIEEEKEASTESQTPIIDESPKTVKAPNDPLEAFLKDKERALIILLIALLSGEERANTSLVLALMYLIM